MAEVSIAFTGFSGIVGVFGGGSALSASERSFRVRLMISGSLVAFFASLAPLVLGQFESVAPLVWMIVCPLFATYLILNTRSVYGQTGALAADGNYSRPWFAPIIYSISLIFSLTLLGAAFGLLPGHAVYILVIVWHLALSSLQFLILVVQTAAGPVE